MPTSKSSANRRGIVAMSLAMACFIANDALVKYASATLPTGQLIFIRGLFATALLLLVAQAMGLLRAALGQHGGALRHLLRRPVLARAALDALGTLAYLASLFHLPIGNATAITMATPLFITLFAVLAWRERVDAARWSTIVIGFAGVLLIVQPAAADFNAWALVCLLGTLLQTARDLVTRAIPRNVPSVLITVTTAITVTLLAGLMSAVQGWQPVTPWHLALLTGASVFLSAAYYLVIVGMREGEMSVVAPFRYTGLLFALLVGWAVWGDIPDLAAWVGIALIVGAGLTMLRGERQG